MYKARHRKQREWNVPVSKGVAAGVAAAGIATVTLGTAASAEAGGTVWDRVAACESGDNWHIDTGNGYYGGLQFSESTWLAYDGASYASRADEAARWEQIQVARRVLAAQGPGAWPVCGPRAGLTSWDGGATSAPLPAHRPGAVHVRQRQRDRDFDRLRQGEQHGRHHHRQHRHTRVVRGARLYRVEAGDTLSGIAARFDVSGGWQHLWRLNRSIVPDPNLLFIGQQLSIPA